jgi:uncharacterized membrane protein YuzA (DUF378 family)
MFCAFVVGLETPHYKLVLSVFVIAGGVATASYGAVDFNLVGIIIMFLSELTESIRLIMTQILLQGHKFNASEWQRFVHGQPCITCMRFACTLCGWVCASVAF